MKRDDRIALLRKNAALHHLYRINMMPLRDLERNAAILCFNNPLDKASEALLVIN